MARGLGERSNYATEEPHILTLNLIRLLLMTIYAETFVLNPGRECFPILSSNTLLSEPRDVSWDSQRLSGCAE
eukprot:4974073-Pyramimonas_sp.AAC.1